MVDDNLSGHRQRLRERFLTEAEGSRADEVLLELLLTFAIPYRDLQPLAQQLVAKHGGLPALLAASAPELLREPGLGPTSVTLLKLVDYLCREGTLEGREIVPARRSTPGCQDPLFDLQALTRCEGCTHQPDHTPTPRLEIEPETQPETEPDPQPEAQPEVSEGEARRGAAQPRPRRGTGLFSNALLNEAIEFLPDLPDTCSLDDVKAYLMSHLHYSAQSTRQRYAQYIARRMFPSGTADQAMRSFARRYGGRQELRDVCFYRFCVSEPFMVQVVEETVLPAIGRGQLSRESLQEYLGLRFPGRDTSNALKGIVNALLGTGWISGDNVLLTYSYRPVLPASLAFVLHSEFPEPGMYPIDALQDRAVMRAMLWNPDGILPALYELRNLGLVSKVSEIDDARQFTLRYTLDEVVDQLCK